MCTQPKRLINDLRSMEVGFLPRHLQLLFFPLIAKMAWALWTRPANCSLPSSRLTEVVSYPEISGPGVSGLIKPFFLINILTLR